MRIQVHYCTVHPDNKQLLDEVEHDIMNYQNRGLCYLPKPSASADNTDLGSASADNTDLGFHNS